jgi:hypothetical protein
LPRWGSRVRIPSSAPNGALAQLGERLLCTQEVSGSIPLGSTNIHNTSILKPHWFKDFLFHKYQISI